MDLLDRIDEILRPRKADRRGERYVLCPFHADRHVGSFSYSERGYKCFACGARGGLHQLAAHLGLDVGASPLPFTPRPRPEPTPFVRPWQRDPDYWERYLRLPDHARAYYHSRGMTDESIERWRLGWGVLPSSKCAQPRYILPVFETGQLVELRGRLADAGACTTCEWQLRGECSPKRGKWLAAGGSGTHLFGAETLGPGKVVVIPEAPYAVILAVQQTPWIAAVAPTAPAHWDDSYTRRIVESEPAWCLVWYDHDEAGEANGQRVFRELQAAGLTVRRWRWNRAAGEKRDLADELSTGRIVPIAKPEPIAATGVNRAYW